MYLCEQKHTIGLVIGISCNGLVYIGVLKYKKLLLLLLPLGTGDESSSDQRRRNH